MIQSIDTDYNMKITLGWLTNHVKAILDFFVDRDGLNGVEDTY